MRLCPMIGDVTQAKDNVGMVRHVCHWGTKKGTIQILNGKCKDQPGKKTSLLDKLAFLL